MTMETIAVGGREREFILHLPTSGTEGLPLIIALHSLNSNARLMEFMTDLSLRADERGFVAAYPQGTGPAGKSSWNALFCCAEARAQKVDDVGFVSEIIELMKERYGTRETFVTGFSNGGMLAHAAGIMLADKIDTIATVGATIGPGMWGMTPPRPVPALLINGTVDRLVPYDVARTDPLLSAREAVRYWVEKNGCNPEPMVNDTAEMIMERYSGGRDGSEVLACRVKDAGHVWPGGRVHTSADHDPGTVRATDMIVHFFESKISGFRARSHPPSGASSASAGAPSWPAGPRDSTL